MDEDEPTPEQIERVKQQELAALQLLEDFRTLVKSTAGRTVIWWLLELCGVYSDDFRGEDTHFMARASGRRSIGLEVIEKVFTADPNGYTLIRNEAVARRIALEKK